MKSEDVGLDFASKLWLPLMDTIKQHLRFILLLFITLPEQTPDRDSWTFYPTWKETRVKDFAGSRLQDSRIYSVFTVMNSKPFQELKLLVCASYKQDTNGVESGFQPSDYQREMWGCGRGFERHCCVCLDVVTCYSGPPTWKSHRNLFAFEKVPVLYITYHNQPEHEFLTEDNN